MWQGLLTEEDVPSIYIDAFSNDYIGDPFISVASAITAFAEKNIKKDNKEKLNELRDKAKKVGGQLLSWSAKVGIKTATFGAIKECDLEELKEIKSDLAKGALSVVERLIEERLNSHSEDIELIQSFKKVLSELPSQLDNSSGNPLIIIIDELDRCKPSFAVELIEKIKHLFSVKNVVFVLVMHKEQLEESVRCIYGQNIDAHTYLQKFISLETSIPKKTNTSYKNDLSVYSRKLLQLHELETWGNDKTIVDCIDPLAKHFNLSLRQLEKVYTNLAILYGSSAESDLRLVPIIVFLSIMKVVNPQVYEKLLNRRISYANLCNDIELPELDEEDREQRDLFQAMRWVRYAILTEQEFQKLGDGDNFQGFDDSLWKYNTKREMLIPFFAQKLSMFSVN